MKKKAKTTEIENIVVISDTHGGCQLALCPPTVMLDNGVEYHASKLQLKLYAMWEEFWDEWVPIATKRKPYIVIHNGDAIDGVHHGSVTQISQNLTDQRTVAEKLMKKILMKPRCEGYYHIRGTEAHGGASGQLEEALAKTLNAEQDEEGRYARWELWMKLKKTDVLIHFSHHIGTTNSASYESTAVYKEYIEACTEAGRWGLRPPDVVVRSHRHRAFKTEVPGERDNALSLVTPAWQLKTPFVYKNLLGRSSTPQIGGIVIRAGDEVPVYSRSKVWNIARPKTVAI